jgi:hypothetical protein
MRIAWASIVLAVGAGACGGGGGEKAPVYTPVSATQDGDLYTLQLGDLKMVIDSAHGARVTEFSLFGENVLLTHDQNHNTYGSDIWPSPQSSWCTAGGGCWPPPASIDDQAYTGAIDSGNAISLGSATTSIEGIADSKIAVQKVVNPVAAQGAVDITYAFLNPSTTVPVTLAPWQLARVMTGGVTFFGQGSGDVTYTLDSDPTFAVTDGASDRWYASAPVMHNSKAFADGTGWLAHATPSRLLYLTSFGDTQPADAAPGEAEIEIFTNRDYVEIEGQGQYMAVPPGESVTWTVRWKLRRVPAGATVQAGDTKLAAFVDSVLAE